MTEHIQRALLAAMPSLGQLLMRVRLVASLPRLATGKVDRAALVQDADQEHSAGSQASMHSADMLPSIWHEPAAAASAAHAATARAAAHDASTSSGGGDGAAAGAQHTTQRQKAVNESTVMAVFVEVLHSLLQQCALALEPADNIVDLGASSLQVAAIAALLDTTPAQVRAAPSCRQLVKALNASAHTSAQQAQGSIAHPAMPQRNVLQQRPALQHSANVLHSQAEDSCLQADTKVHACGQRRQSSTGSPSAAAPSAQNAFCSERVRLRVTDSRGEVLTAHVGTASLPGGHASKGNVHSAGQGGKHAVSVPSKRQACDGSAATQPHVLATLHACVDAPLTALQYECERSSIAQCSCVARTWLLASSHAGDVACISVDTGQRAWTAWVPSSPDAGGQVTPCGTAFVVAAMDGCLYALSVADGSRLCQAGTGGQLRRCAKRWPAVSGAQAHRRCASSVEQRL